jgi:DNA-binding MarR family transcriptional regulator
MDVHSYYAYKLLEHLEKTPNMTNRIASAKLGVSVKLTHIVVSKLIEKGLIHTTKRDGRSFFYFLTPKGIAEKARLTYEFLDFTRQFYKQARQRSSEVCQKLALSGIKHVAILGAGDLAEITYLGIVEHHLKLTHIYDDTRTGSNFMGMPVQPLDSLQQNGKERFSKILVALYDPKEPLLSSYLPKGVTQDERFVWVMEPEELMNSIKQNAPAPIEDSNDNDN